MIKERRKVIEEGAAIAGITPKQAILHGGWWEVDWPVGSCKRRLQGDVLHHAMGGEGKKKKKKKEGRRNSLLLADGMEWMKELVRKVGELENGWNNQNNRLYSKSIGDWNGCRKCSPGKQEDGKNQETGSKSWTGCRCLISAIEISHFHI